VDCGDDRKAQPASGRWLDRLTVPWADRIIAVSGGVLSDFSATHPGRSGVVVPNGLDFARVERLQSRAAVRASWDVGEDDVIVGTAARCTAQKGLTTFVEAARRVAATSPRARFVHMGDGPLRSDVERQVADAGLSARFRFLGQLSDPMALLPGLDVFVLPSLWEGMPIALLEAMAAAVAPIGSDIAGINEVIQHGRSGMLVPVADPTALATVIGSLVDDPERRRALACGASERVRAFDAARQAPAYRRVVADAVAGPRR
jgi:glycosyltransferase involved in cell wall biosynthesis